MSETPLSDQGKERIYGPAIRSPFGWPVALPIPASHYAISKTWPDWNLLENAQGFLTNTGRFVGRTEAKRIADAAGQIVNPISGGSSLFSDELWTPEPA